MLVEHIDKTIKCMKHIVLTKEITNLLTEHKDFLILMSDIAGCCISDIAWSRTRSYLSPAYHYDVSEPIMMTPILISQVELKIFNFVIFKERKLIKLYLDYQFPGFEGAACNEFLLHSSLDIKQVMEQATHQVRKEATNGNKTFGIISVQATEISGDADILYRELIKKLSD